MGQQHQTGYRPFTPAVSVTAPLFNSHRLRGSKGGLYLHMRMCMYMQLSQASVWAHVPGYIQAVQSTL